VQACILAEKAKRNLKEERFSQVKRLISSLSVGGCVAIKGLDWSTAARLESVCKVGFTIVDASPLASGWSMNSGSFIQSLGSSCFTRKCLISA
jgi:hypothetical protein